MPPPRPPPCIPPLRLSSPTHTPGAPPPHPPFKGAQPSFRCSPQQLVCGQPCGGPPITARRRPVRCALPTRCTLAPAALCPASARGGPAALCSASARDGPAQPSRACLPAACLLCPDNCTCFFRRRPALWLLVKRQTDTMMGRPAVGWSVSQKLQQQLGRLRQVRHCGLVV